MTFGFAQPVGHLPGAVGRVDLGPRLRRRSGPRRVHPGAADHQHRRQPGTLCVARAGAQGRRIVRPDQPRGRLASEQLVADHGGGDRVHRHALSATA